MKQNYLGTYGVLKDISNKLNYIYLEDLEKSNENLGVTILKCIEEKKEYIVKEDEVFVLGTNDKSFDSRYYGCIKKSDVIYKLVPLIIWEDI